MNGKTYLYILVCAAALYQLAMQRGGKDNISVLLVGIDR